MLGKKIKNFTFAAYNPVKDCFEEHCLAEYGYDQKWLVLFFYPADFTFICPTELADMAAHYGQLQRLGVEVISVSTDSKYSHLAWCRAEALLGQVPFLMASDPTGAMAGFFGMTVKRSGGVFRYGHATNRAAV